jgi:hypothetical protein
MAEQDDGSGWKSSSRGESAWKEDTQRVASRNAEARKAGRLERHAYERGREDARRAIEQGRQIKLLNRRTRSR